MDLSKDEGMRTAFSGSLTVDAIIRNIGMFRWFEHLVPGKTLIFLDEIQSCPRARESLKSFSLDRRFDVIASSSLIDAVPDPEDGRPPVLPVGYEEHYRMYGLDFEEFLWANGIPDEVILDIKRSIHDIRPLEEPMLTALDPHFRDYMITGGMPRAVSDYLDNGFAGTETILQSLIETGKQDIVKYAKGSEIPKTIKCLESIPSQLSQSNKKYMYSRIDGN